MKTQKINNKKINVGINGGKKKKSPVLFLTYSRLETTKKVFYKIKKYCPNQLFLASDGPRNNQDSAGVLEVRQFLLNNVDWPCEIKTLFRKKNLGCGKAVSGAIDWFFKHVEGGIILEDDCVPSESFFTFCELLLEKYASNDKVMHISGSNSFINSDSDTSYFFSKRVNIWGWATWRRAWNKYSFKIRDWEKIKKTSAVLNNNEHICFSKSLKISLDYIMRGVVDTWDYQWSYAVLANNGLVVIPSKNLISNIGYFGDHSFGSSSTNNLPTFKLSTVIHPQKIIVNSNYEEQQEMQSRRQVPRLFFYYYLFCLMDALKISRPLIRIYFYTRNYFSKILVFFSLD
jgi:hypothetical protein